MDLGHAIKLCRTQRGLSQVELADAIAISVSYLSLLERGKRDPVFSIVENIAEVLNIPLLLLVYLASNEADMHGITEDAQSKLAYAAVEILRK